MIFGTDVRKSEPVNIGALVYALVLQEGVIDRGDAYYGLHSSEALELRIDSTQPLQRQVVSTLHEAMHAMDAQSNMKLEEEQVTTMAFQLTAFMRDNAELISDMLSVLAEEK